MRIGFWLPDLAAPSGGVSYAYRCARHLQAAGHEVSLIHSRAGFEYRWEARGSVPVVSVRTVRRRGTDVLVVPEIFAASGELDGAARATIVMNQNPFLTGGPASDGCYRTGVGVLATSDYTERYLRLRYPGVRVERIVVGVDVEVFRPGPPAGRRGTTLAWMPRKRAEEAGLVMAALPAGQWEPDAIDGVADTGVAARLGAAAVFLAMGEREGLGLPVAEAMACATPCVGFTGVGGGELLTPDTGWPVPDGDVAALLETLAQVRSAIVDGDPEIGRRTAAARALILDRYTREHEQESVLAGFAELLAP